MKYILDENRTPVPCPDTLEWGMWMEKNDRKIARTLINNDITVSTVFLGLDHNYSNNGEPILYETMVFGGELNEEMYRYTSEEEALEGHETMVRRVKATCPDP